MLLNLNLYSYFRRICYILPSILVLLNSHHKILVKMSSLTRFSLFVALIVSHITSSPLLAQPVEILDAGRLQLALKKLTVLGSMLYIAAHPDDENTAVLTYAENEKLIRTAYLSITRGDGGQNLIGSEQAELLGIIRTQELLAARRIDGAEQFFTRAIDFGYSKSANETMEFWNKEKILSDVVWIIRSYRPDIIINRFPSTNDAGHGHHTASAVIAEEAFYAAGDSKRFQEQLKFVRPWQPKRLLWNGWLTLIQQRGIDTTSLIKLDIGKYNSLLGKSYTELSAESRSMHKSQGFGSSGQRGETLNYFVHIAGDSAKNDLFDGIDLNWSRVIGGDKIGTILTRAYQNFKPENPSAILPTLIDAYNAMEKLQEESWVRIKREELLMVIRSCLGLWTEAIASEYSSPPGNSVKISSTIINRSQFPLTLKNLLFSFGNKDTVLTIDLHQGKPMHIENSFTIPTNLNISQPYWLWESIPSGKEHPDKGTFRVDNQSFIGMPENSQPTVGFNLEAAGSNLTFSTPILYRWTDRVNGEQYRRFEITPPVTIQLDENVYVFPEKKSRKIEVTLLSRTQGISGTLRLKLPNGWSANPELIPFSLERKDEELNVSILISPPEHQSEGQFIAEVETKTGTFSQSMISLRYPHIPIQTIFPPAQAKLIRLNINRAEKNIGYIMGSGDEIPNYLAQLGYRVTPLTDEKIDEGNLADYHAIITGVRAYNTRPRLKHQQKKLLEYVKTGGTLIVQYNVTRELVTDQLGPYPFKISNDRVTDENAALTFLLPDHPLLQSPNRITQDDFVGWVQERGLYFANEWDSSYQTVLECHDPNEAPRKGGLLIATHGKGKYIYTGYSFFRQLPAGVLGAYKLFVNMIECRVKKIQ